MFSLQVDERFNAVRVQQMVGKLCASEQWALAYEGVAAVMASRWVGAAVSCGSAVQWRICRACTYDQGIYVVQNFAPGGQLVDQRCVPVGAACRTQARVRVAHYCFIGF